MDPRAGRAEKSAVRQVDALGELSIMNHDTFRNIEY